MLNDLQSAIFLVYKYITRGSKGTLILTIIVTTLAFAEINLISGIFNGAISLAYQQVKDNYVSNIVIQPGKDEDYLTQLSNLKNIINAVPGIVSCSSRYAMGASISYDPDKNGKDVKSIGWTIKSINAAEEIKVTSIQDYMIAGEYLEDSDRDKIIMGREISGGYGASLEVQSLKGASVGDEVTVRYNNGVKRVYTIKGIYTTIFPLSDMGVFVTEREMESVLGLHNRASEILVKTDEQYTEQYYIQKLRQAGLVKEEIKPWNDFIGLISGITQSFDIIKKIVFFIGLMVTGVTIFIVIFIATTSRRKQIGIMKAIGMKERIVIASYIFLALFYSILGISLGVIIIEFALKPYFIGHPLILPMGRVSLLIAQVDFITSVISMIVVSIVAGFVPSWRVTRENIIRAIWG
ncbi:MAG: FtsX-like permease family protein [Chloroflexi bacterium]|nr:FtsX-like permease family protein [Chloroflexota bacterium]